MRRAKRAVLVMAVVAAGAMAAFRPAVAADAPAADAAAVAAAQAMPRHAYDEHPGFVLAPADPVHAAAVAESNADCLSCHSEQGVQAPPRPGLDTAKLATLTISKAAMDLSAHRGLACTTCHGEAWAAYPHPDAAAQPPRDCVSCHPKMARTIQPDFEESRHFLRHRDQFSCTSCHDPHTMRTAASLGTPGAVARADNHACLSCHADADRYAAFHAKGPMPDLERHHAWLPDPALHGRSVRCIDCHVAATEAGYTHRFLRIVNANRSCVSCHSEAAPGLRTRLYRQALYQPPVDGLGFTNSAVLTQSYVIGATRNVWLDGALTGLAALLLAGLGAHGALRFATRRRAGDPAPAHRVFLFAGWIRLWHWLNAALMLALLVSGLSLHLAGSALPLIGFAWAKRIHDACGIALGAAFAVFVAASLIGGNWRAFRPGAAGLAGRMACQARYYLWDIFHGRPAPFPTTVRQPFNPLQQVTYAFVVAVAMPVLIVSGLVFLFPETLPARLWGLDALTVVAVVHTVAAALVILFTVAHIYLATTGRTPLAHIRSMLTGWHDG